MMFVYESLGSAQPCPGSAILPPDYMQTTGAAPLESTAKTEKPFPTAALVVGGLLVGGGILWLLSGGAIVLDNPGASSPSTDEEKAKYGSWLQSVINTLIRIRDIRAHYKADPSPQAQRGQSETLQWKKLPRSTRDEIERRAAEISNVDEALDEAIGDLIKDRNWLVREGHEFWLDPSFRYDNSLRDVHGAVQVGDVFDEFGREWVVTRVDKKKREVWVETRYKDSFGKMRVDKNATLHFRDLESMKKLPRDNPGKKKPKVRKDINFAGFDFTIEPDGDVVVHRGTIDTSAPGDYGADPLGDGMFRMVPSGDVVDYEERNRRLKRFHPKDNPGLAAKRGITRADVDPSELRRGVKHEMEHTDSPKVAERIALDHLAESSEYYSKLEACESCGAACPSGQTLCLDCERNYGDTYDEEPMSRDNPVDNSTLAIGAAIGAAVAGIAWLLTRKSSTTSTTATGPLPAPPTPLTTPQSTTAPLTTSQAPFVPASPSGGSAPASKGSVVLPGCVVTQAALTAWGAARGLLAVQVTTETPHEPSVAQSVAAWYSMPLEKLVVVTSKGSFYKYVYSAPAGKMEAWLGLELKDDYCKFILGGSASSPTASFGDVYAPLMPGG